jgi:hypothetical protein
MAEIQESLKQLVRDCLDCCPESDHRRHAMKFVDS